MEFRDEDYSFSPNNFAKLFVTSSLLYEQEIDRLRQNLEAEEKRNAYLIEQIRLSKIRKFGKKSESSESLQLKLFDEVVDDEEEKENQETVDPKDLRAIETITYTRKKKAVGRKIDTSKLPREIVVHDLPEEEKCCKQCGAELEKFGEDHSEQLEYIPEQIKVIEHVSPKYTCRCCETVKMASKPEMPIAKSMAAPSLIAEVIIKKYEHHLPWHRQAKIFLQEGIDIPANTICNWFLQAGEVLSPLKEALKKEIDNTNVLQADETPVKVLQNDNQGYMWGYHSCKPENRFVIFEYNNSRSGKVPSNTLEKYQGILQSDGYSGYNQLRAKKGVINIGCWAHCRRNFVETVKLTNSAGKAYEVVKLIKKLYEVEGEAREQKLDFADRKKLRQKQAPPILQEIKNVINGAAAPPKSALGKAITYAKNQWWYLARYIDHGEAEIDNNWIENQIRPFAISRKNWLFIGNEKAAQTAAFFYSLIQTCRLNKIDARKYLIYVLTKAQQMRRGEIDPSTLLPQFINPTLLP